jgi:hypothetical protein
MPFWIARRAAPAIWKRVPWKMVWVTAVWLVEKGRDRAKRNLAPNEQRELLNLVAKSKGRPSNLSQQEKTRLKNIAGKAIRG